MKFAWDELVFGRRKDPLDPKVFHRLALVALLAWVGLGADGLSSSCYGPEEGFKALGEYRGLALFLAGIMVLTIFTLSASYAQIISLFPSGGGGYTVTTKLLGRGPGVVCGCALVLDYLLTIAISVASGVDALLSLLPEPAPGGVKLAGCAAALLLLAFLNLRGVKESILVLLPIFAAFVLTHAVAILAALGGHLGEVGEIMARTGRETSQAAGTLGVAGVVFLVLRAYTAGAGTYTGLEAVSNSMGILREPRVATARRTMFYMAVSLGFTAVGLFVGYLLLDVAPVPGRTLNAVFLDGVVSGWSVAGLEIGSAFLVLALASEGALLFVAAQAGFTDGPRVMATMAVDRWIPTRFAHLSDRLVVQDGVLFLALGAGAFIVATGAQVRVLVILYSTCVFLTFVLSQLGMCVHWVRRRGPWSRFAVNATGFSLAAVILTFLVLFHFREGVWVAVAATALAVFFCAMVRRHYSHVSVQLRRLDTLAAIPAPAAPRPAEPPAADAPTAIVLVSQFGGVGMHLLLTIHRLFPGQYKRFVFLSVGMIDYDRFKGADEIEALSQATEEGLKKYGLAATALGAWAEFRSAVGTDVVEELEPLCVEVARQHPRSVIFMGQLIYPEATFWTRLLHGHVARDLERRLLFRGLPVLMLPLRLVAPQTTRA